MIGGSEEGARKGQIPVEVTLMGRGLDWAPEHNLTVELCEIVSNVTQSCPLLMSSMGDGILIYTNSPSHCLGLHFCLRVSRSTRFYSQRILREGSPVLAGEAERMLSAEGIDIGSAWCKDSKLDLHTWT